jgi:BlaI family penicillinase repressor
MRVRDMEIGEVQERFANLVWDHEPIPSGQLVKLCEQELNWKKPTTYTVLRKLCEKGLFRNEDGLVSAVLTREQFASRRSEQFVDNAFHGSLPAFVAAFTAQKGLSAREAEEIQQMIDKFRKEE